jgi:hypothetical protein
MLAASLPGFGDKKRQKDPRTGKPAHREGRARRMGPGQEFRDPCRNASRTRPPPDRRPPASRNRYEATNHAVRASTILPVLSECSMGMEAVKGFFYAQRGEEQSGPAGVLASHHETIFSNFERPTVMSPGLPRGAATTNSRPAEGTAIRRARSGAGRRAGCF